MRNKNCIFMALFFLTYFLFIYNSLISYSILQPEAFKDINYIKNSNFENKKDRCYPNDWYMNQRYYHPNERQDINCSPFSNGLNMGKTIAEDRGFFYWQFNNPGIILSQESKELPLRLFQDVSLINSKNSSKLDLTKPFYIGGYLKKLDDSIVSQNLYPDNKMNNFSTGGFVDKPMKEIAWKTDNPAPQCTGKEVCIGLIPGTAKTSFRAPPNMLVSIYDPSFPYYDKETGAFQIKINIPEFCPSSDCVESYIKGNDILFLIDIGDNKTKIFTDQLYIYQAGITAEVKPMEINLGTKLNKNLLEKYITLTLHSQKYPNFTAQINSVEVLGTSNIIVDEGSKDWIANDAKQGYIDVLVKTPLYEIDGSGTQFETTTQIPTVVTWGDSIAIKGISEVDNNESTDLCIYGNAPNILNQECKDKYNNRKNKTIFSLSLLKEGGSTNLVGTFGNLDRKDLNNSINPAENKDDLYAQIDYFKYSESNFNEDLGQKGVYTLPIYNKDTPKEILSRWNDINVKDINMGDIIRVWLRNPSRGLLYKDSKLILSTDKLVNGSWVYYEITDDGFRPIYNNQVKAKTGIKVPAGSTEEQINEMFSGEGIDLLLDIPNKENYKNINYQLLKFLDYPSMNNPNTEVNGKVMISSSSKINNKDLTINFSVEPTFFIEEYLEPIEVDMRINYYQIINGKETEDPVLLDLKNSKPAESITKKVMSNTSIDGVSEYRNFDQYIYKKTVILDEDGNIINNATVPRKNIIVNHYYSPLTSIDLPDQLSFGNYLEPIRLKQYWLVHDYDPIVIKTGVYQPDWKLFVRTDGLYLTKKLDKLLPADFYFNISDNSIKIDNQDTLLLDKKDMNYFELPLSKTSSNEGLFLKVTNTKFTKGVYQGMINFNLSNTY